MATLSRDTSEEAEAVQIRLLRAMPVWRRAEILNGVIRNGREMALASLRRRFPEASPEALRRRFANVMLGEELAAKIYGADRDTSTAP